MTPHEHMVRGLILIIILFISFLIMCVTGWGNAILFNLAFWVGIIAEAYREDKKDRRR